MARQLGAILWPQRWDTSEVVFKCLLHLLAAVGAFGVDRCIDLVDICFKERGLTGSKIGETDSVTLYEGGLAIN